MANTSDKYLFLGVKQVPKSVYDTFTDVQKKQFVCFVKEADDTYGVYFNNIRFSNETYTESEINTLLSGKQDTLTAGSGITIENNVISAIGGGGGNDSWRTIKVNGTDFLGSSTNTGALNITGGTNASVTTGSNGTVIINATDTKYTQGTGIEITNDNKINCTVTDTDTWRTIKVNGTDFLGSGTNTSALNITGGTNASVTTGTDGKVIINATDTKYTASDFDIKDLTDSTGLRSTWSGKQNALTQGTGIQITNDVISCTVTDTWRTIKVNGTDFLGSGTNTSALNITGGTNASVTTGTDGKVIINAVDTKYTQGTGIEITNDNKINCTVTDTNTWRPIKVNNTDFLTDNTTSLNITGGTNASVTTGSNGTVIINTVDTTYSEGRNVTISSGNNAINAEGYTYDSAITSFAITGNTASAQHSFAEGNSTVAIGDNSHAEGSIFYDSDDAMTIGKLNPTLSGFSYYEESLTLYTGGTIIKIDGTKIAEITDVKNDYLDIVGEDVFFFAVDDNTLLENALTNHTSLYFINNYSGISGYITVSSGVSSHAEGGHTQAVGDFSHSEGINTVALGYASHTEGNGTTALRVASHAEGDGTTASGYASHAEGLGTVANLSYMSAIGKFNKSGVTDELFVVGTGTSNFARKNGLVVHSGGTNSVTATVDNTTDVYLGVPIGSVVMWIGSSAPNSWKLCNGHEITMYSSGSTTGFQVYLKVVINYTTYQETVRISNDYQKLVSKFGTINCSGTVRYQNNTIGEITGITVIGGGTKYSVPLDLSSTDSKLYFLDFTQKFPLGAKQGGTIGKNGNTSTSTGWSTNLGSSGGEDKHTLGATEIEHQHNSTETDTNTGVSVLRQTSTSVASVNNIQPHNNIPPFFAINFIIKCQ